MANKWTKVNQLEAGIEWLKGKIASLGDKYEIVQAEFDTESGVGVDLSEADIQNLVDSAWSHYSKEIEEEKYDFKWNNILVWIKEANKWADSKVVMSKMQEKQLATLGEKPANDGKRKKPNKKTTEEKSKMKVNAPKDPEAVASTGKNIADLEGRVVNNSNSEELLKKHREFTKGKIYTRFPPEPNGYLHIGHAKAIRFNFTVAAENGGYTYLRFDDTNPCKEN